MHYPNKHISAQGSGKRLCAGSFPLHLHCNETWVSFIRTSGPLGAMHVHSSDLHSCMNIADSALHDINSVVRSSHSIDELENSFEGELEDMDLSGEGVSGNSQPAQDCVTDNMDGVKCTQIRGSQQLCAKTLAFSCFVQNTLVLSTTGLATRYLWRSNTCHLRKQSHGLWSLRLNSGAQICIANTGITAIMGQPGN